MIRGISSIKSDFHTMKRLAVTVKKIDFACSASKSKEMLNTKKNLTQKIRIERRVDSFLNKASKVEKIFKKV